MHNIGSVEADCGRSYSYLKVAATLLATRPVKLPRSSHRSPMLLNKCRRVIQKLPHANVATGQGPRLGVCWRSRRWWVARSRGRVRSMQGTARSSNAVAGPAQVAEVPRRSLGRWRLLSLPQLILCQEVLARRTIRPIANAPLGRLLSRLRRQSPNACRLSAGTRHPDRVALGPSTGQPPHRPAPPLGEEWATAAGTST